MCMMGNPGSRNLLHLIPEVRAQRDAETAFSVGEDDDGDGDEEEGGNRGDRRSVAFPRVTDEKVIGAPQQDVGQVFFFHAALLSSHRANPRCHTALQVTSVNT